MLERANRVATEKLYNSRLFFYAIKLFREKYPHINVSDLLDYAGIDRTAVDDPLEWFTQEQSDRFFERIGIYFEKLDDIARECGREFFSDKALGFWRQFSLKILGVGYAYRHIDEYAPTFTRTSTFSSRQLSSNRYEIKVKFHMKERIYQEFYRLGILEAAPLIYSAKMAKVKSSARGDTTTYIVTWDAFKSDLVDRARVWFIFLAPVCILLVWLTGRTLAGLHMAAIAIIVYISLLAVKYKLKFAELTQSTRIKEQTTETVLQNYIEDYEQVKTLNRIGRIMLRSNTAENFLPTISDLLRNLNYTKSAFFITDFDNRSISLKFLDGYDRSLGAIKIRINDLGKTQLYPKLPMVIRDSTDIAKILSSDLPIGFTAENYPQVFVPIISDAAFLGFFFVTPHGNLLPIGKRKLDFLVGVASYIALGLHKERAFHNLAESDRLKSSFITTVSHELKTPIQMMIMGLDEMEQSCDIAENLPLLKGVAANMKSLVENFLSLQRIENQAYRLDIQAFSPAALLKELKEEIHRGARAFSHRILFTGFTSDRPEITGDLKRLSLAMMNLFRNSCKFTPRPGIITIIYDYDSTEHRISVVDNGIGISKNNMEKVFIKFYQIPGPHAVSGFGLGLSIAKEVVTLHNGYISVSSPPKENTHQLEHTPDRPGTAMTVHLPREQRFPGSCAA